jgi:hypothetical protein
VTVVVFFFETLAELFAQKEALSRILNGEDARSFGQLLAKLC